jgi:hypothetical protein
MFCLLGLFGPLTLAEADTRAAAVLVDEFDAGPPIVAQRCRLLARLVNPSIKCRCSNEGEVMTDAVNL